MAKKVLDEKPKDTTETKAKKTASKAEAKKETVEVALEEVEKEEKAEKEIIEEGCKKCGAKKFIFPTVIVLVVAAIGCLCFFGYKMIFGSNPVSITTKAIRGLKDTIEDAKDDSDGLSKILSGDDAFEVTSNIDVTLPENMGKYSLDMLLQADSKNESGKFDLIAKQNKKEIINLNTILNDSKLYFKLADTMKNYYFINIKDAVKDLESSISEIESEIDPELLNLLSKYDFTKLIDYTADAVDDALDKDDFKKTKEEITVNGKDVKATKYTAKIDEKVAVKVAKGLLKKVKKDKDLVSIVAKATGLKESEVTKQIDELLESEPSEYSDEYVLYSVYVSSLGNTLGYGFEIENVGKVIITEKGDVTTISISAGEFYGSIEVEEKSDDHIIISGNLMGLITAELDIKSDTDTIKKNKEYKETLDLDLTISAMGQNISAKVSSVTKIKKISKVDTDKVTDAINIENMTQTDMEKFYKELQKSSLFPVLESILNK